MPDSIIFFSGFQSDLHGNPTYVWKNALFWTEWTKRQSELGNNPTWAGLPLPVFLRSSFFSFGHRLLLSCGKSNKVLKSSTRRYSPICSIGNYVSNGSCCSLMWKNISCSWWYLLGNGFWSNFIYLDTFIYIVTYSYFYLMYSILLLMLMCVKGMSHCRTELRLQKWRSYHIWSLSLIRLLFFSEAKELMEMLNDIEDLFPETDVPGMCFLSAFPRHI